MGSRLPRSGGAVEHQTPTKSGNSTLLVLRGGTTPPARRNGVPQMTPELDGEVTPIMRRTPFGVTPPTTTIAYCFANCQVTGKDSRSAGVRRASRYRRRCDPLHRRLIIRVLCFRHRNSQHSQQHGDDNNREDLLHAHSLAYDCPPYAWAATTPTRRFSRLLAGTLQAHRCR